MIRSKSSATTTTLMQNIQIFKQTYSFNDDKICLILCCNVENILTFSHISYSIKFWCNIHQTQLRALFKFYFECI